MDYWHVGASLLPKILLWANDFKCAGMY